MTDYQAPQEAAHKDTGDFTFAAYLLMRGLQLIKARDWRTGKNWEYMFTFNDPPWTDPTTGEEFPNGRWEQLWMDFANSEAATFDAFQRRLKKILMDNAKKRDNT